MVLVEICASSLESVAAAIKAGAHRIEFCKDLEVGGLTPEFEDIESALRMIRTSKTMRMHVLIRPRPGNFCYSNAEVNRICEDIKRCREMGADGVVIGALTSEGDPDTKALKQMLQATGREQQPQQPQQPQLTQQPKQPQLTQQPKQPRQPTESAPQLPQQPLPPSLHLVFHRAFDVCRNPHHALEVIIGLGFQTLLTSGLEQKAEEGMPLIAQLVKQAAGRIDIMAGSGVNPRNVLRIIEETGVRAVHLSATKAPDPKDPGHLFSLPPAVRRNLPPQPGNPVPQPQAVPRTFPHSNEEIIREVMALVSTLKATSHRLRQHPI